MIAVVPPAIHSELMNWRRFCWSGPWPWPTPPTRAASAEGKWLPPSDLGESDDEVRPPPIDREKAALIQAVYDYMLGHQERPVLRAEYVWRHAFTRKAKDGTMYFDRGDAAREVGIPLHVYEGILGAAARTVAKEIS